MYLRQVDFVCGWVGVSDEYLQRHDEEIPQTKSSTPLLELARPDKHGHMRICLHTG